MNLGGKYSSSLNLLFLLIDAIVTFNIIRVFMCRLLVSFVCVINFITVNGCGFSIFIWLGCLGIFGCGIALIMIRDCLGVRSGYGFIFSLSISIMLVTITYFLIYLTFLISFIFIISR